MFPSAAARGLPSPRAFGNFFGFTDFADFTPVLAPCRLLMPVLAFCSLLARPRGVVDDSALG
jgi:hypothetical protein